MNAHASTLDTDKLRKLKALMDGGKTPGERRAAETKAAILASRAGLTLKQALSKLDRPTPQPVQDNPFAGFADWMEAKEPGWKARNAAERAEREARRIARCREILAEYGDEDAVFAPSEIEAALRDALRPFDTGEGFWNYRGFSYSDGPTDEMWQAIRAAVAIPGTVSEALAAYRAFIARQEPRFVLEPAYNPWEWESAWESALEHLLDNLRSPTAEGISARLEWMQILADKDCSRDHLRDRQTLAALRDDFAAFSASVQTGQPQTEAQRRTTVNNLLRQHPEFTDREIARRAGVSPTTVGKQRRKMERSYA